VVGGAAFAVLAEWEVRRSMPNPQK
jgi:hypothetical protein